MFAMFKYILPDRDTSYDAYIYTLLHNLYSCVVHVIIRKVPDACYRIRCEHAASIFQCVQCYNT